LHLSYPTNSLVPSPDLIFPSSHLSPIAEASADPCHSDRAINHQQPLPKPVIAMMLEKRLQSLFPLDI